MRRFAFVVAVGVALAIPAFAGASTWEIDSAHSSAEFAVRHMMVSTVRGTLGKITGTVTLDDQDITKSAVDATIDATTIDTREPKRDGHLKGADFFNVATFPTITFKSKKVSVAGGKKYQVTGDLTMHGVTKEVVLDAEGSPIGIKDPMGNIKLGGVVHTKLNRKDFGINWSTSLDGGGVVLSDEVDVTIDLELVKK